MKTRTVIAWISAGAGLVAGFAWLAGWFNERTSPGLKPRPAGGGVDRPVAEVVSRETETFLPVPGRLWAQDRTRITSEITGKITDISVVAGDQVEVGTVLVTLDQTELAARVSRIRQQLPAAEQRVQEAESQFDRDQELVKDNAISREAVETSRRRLAEAQAALAATRQELVEAEGQLDESTIEATMSGTVVDQLAKVGEVARPGATLLEVYQPTTLRLECSVPESLAGKLEVGQSLRAEIGREQDTQTVTIDEIVPQADARTRTVLVKARVERSESFFEGQYGRLFAPLDRREKLIVPAAAMQVRGQLDFVEVVTEDRGTERRFVKRGAPLPPDEIEILSGLRAGERVVLAPR